MKTWMRRTGVGLGLAGILAAGMPHAWAQPMGLPSMGAVSSSELSPAVERTLGQAIMEQGRQDPTYIGDLDINQYLTALGRKLAAHAPQALAQDITVFAVRDPSINAFALPGGYIGVHSGLVVGAQSESELAGVLAHEIGHVMQRHIARGIAQQSQGTGIMVASLVGALLAALAGQGDLAMGVATFGQAAAIDRQLGFSRGAEQEADRAGLQMMRQAGFDPQGMLAMFRRLMNASRLNEGTGGGYASTHPLSIQRLSDIENRIEGQPAAAVTPDPEFWFVRARLALIQARSHADRQRLKQTLRSEARDLSGVRQAAAYYGLASLGKAEGDLASARAQLAQAQSVQAAAPQLDMLAIQLAGAQGAAAAVDVSAAAWKRWPDSQGVADERARALQKAGQDAAAADFLQAATRQWPETPEFQKLLATSLERLGREVEAHEAMASYFEQTGALPTAVEHLQQARTLSKDFYAQSRLDTRIRALRERLDNQRALLEPFKK
ncbi:M48 family metalloprotease [Castellaniella daejeonensis]|jgi:predicted Zn-dependent protease|uniref:M48 family metalloprotease n=1 Tax=Castellaniella daejeonensis TaxID=659013 RepID=A0ABN0TTL1_9BURK|nr:M48 family metalloprotease [Castellaniella sp.]HET8702645.1 M48 family metalloprotease [Castellaniella sp.]